MNNYIKCNYIKYNYTASQLCYCLLLLTALAVAAPPLSAEPVLQSKIVTKSKYYTGKTGEASIDYISLKNWLKHRSGDSQPKDIYNRGFIIDNPKVVMPLYDIANRLLQGWPGSVPEMAIFVRADSASSVYGAEALVANEMLVYYGSLVNVKSDDELAALVAHELAHILLGHTKKANYINVALQLFEDYEAFKNLHDTIEAGQVVKTGEKEYKVEFDTDTLSVKVLRAGKQRERATELYRAYHSSVLGKNAESKADLLAADLLIRAGYSPLGLRHSLERLGSSYLVEQLISDMLNESSETLVSTVQTAMAEQIKSFNEDGELTGDLNSAFSEVGTGLVKSLEKSAVDFAWKRLKSAHPVPDSRLKKLAEHLSENYSLRQRARPIQSQSLDQYRKAGMMSIASYKKIEMAQVAIMNGELDTAASRGLAALSGSRDGDPYKRFTAHRIRRDQGKVSSALTNIKRIDSYIAVPNSALTEMLDLLLENGQTGFASEAIGQKEQFGEVIHSFYPAKIQIALEREDDKQAKTLAADCVGNRKVPKETRDRCLAYGLSEAPAKTPSGGLFGGLKSATSALTNIVGGQGREEDK